MPDHRRRVCFSGIRTELQTLPSAKAGPELQSCRRPGGDSAVCQAESGLSQVEEALRLWFGVVEKIKIEVLV